MDPSLADHSAEELDQSLLADGDAAGREVFHVHLHVVPRYPGDGFGLDFPAGYPRRAERAALDDMAEALAGALFGTDDDG